MHIPLENHSKYSDCLPILSEDEKLLQTLEGRKHYYRRQLDLLYTLRTQSEKRLQQTETLNRLRQLTEKNAVISVTAGNDDDSQVLIKDDELIHLTTAFDEYYRFQLDTLYRMKSQVEARIRQAVALIPTQKEKKQWELLKISQIRNLFLRHIPSRKCASLLIADIASVEFIYAKLQDCPDMDAPSLWDALNSNGLLRSSPLLKDSMESDFDIITAAFAPRQ